MIQKGWMEDGPISGTTGEKHPQAKSQTAKRLRLALVDDDEGAQFSLRELIATRAQGWTLDIYPTPHFALRIPRLPAAPDVVFMGLGLATRPGLDCTRKLKSQLPDLPIVMLATSLDQDGILLSFLEGADGYLIKPVSPEDLLCAMWGAQAGWPVLCREAEKAVLSGLHRAGARSVAWGLTWREREILTMLVQRLCEKDIARRLGVAVNTVHVHLRRIFRKLGVHTREEAARKFIGAL